MTYSKVCLSVHRCEAAKLGKHLCHTPLLHTQPDNLLITLAIYNTERKTLNGHQAAFPPRLPRCHFPESAPVKVEGVQIIVGRQRLVVELATDAQQTDRRLVAIGTGVVQSPRESGLDMYTGVGENQVIYVHTKFGGEAEKWRVPLIHKCADVFVSVLMRRRFYACSGDLHLFALFVGDA